MAISGGRIRTKQQAQKQEPGSVIRRPHSRCLGSIKVTFDVYGHLFSDSDADQRAAEEIQLRLLGA